MHSQRLSRQFERTLAQLRELQKTRRDQEQQQLDDLVDIIEMYEDTGEAYKPANDGFVFSAKQIARHRQARTRERLASEACEYLS